MRRIVTVVIAGAALAAAASAMAGAGATPDGKLLARYAPILVLHPQERFVPVPVGGFIADSDLLARDTAGGWTPFAGSLAEAPAESRLDQRSCDAAGGPAAISCYSAAQDAHAALPTAYGAVFRSANRIALQYWLFYPFDAWSPTVPAGPFWKAHEGDWEAVTVLLDRKERPRLVGVSRHCGGVRRTWPATQKRGTRPMVWVGLGAHANAFKPGRFGEERRCWPDVALAIFDAYKRTLVDVAATGRSVSPRVVRVNGTSPSWMRFRGTWGADQYAGFPDVPPFRFGSGPEGPALHTLWRRPFAEPLAWPPG